MAKDRILKPPAGIDPTTDWSEYVSYMGVDADTDKKKKLAFGLGVASIFKSNEDLNLTKKTASKITNIEKEEEVTNAIIDNRFNKRNKFLEDITLRGGRAVQAEDIDGNPTFEILNKDRVVNSFIRDEINLAQENLVIKGFAKDRQLSNEAREQAILKGQIRAENFITNKSLYDWRFRTAAEAKQKPNEFYTQAKSSLNKKRYGDFIVKKWFETTGNYVENPHVEFVEAGNGIRDLYTNRDTEFSKNITKLDQDAAARDSSANKEIVSKLENLRDNSTDETTIKTLNDNIKMFQEGDFVDVMPLSPTAGQVDAVRKLMADYTFGAKVANNLDTSIDSWVDEFRFQSVLTGGNHDLNVLFFSALPTETDPKTVKFLNPSERVAAITEDKVKVFKEQEELEPTFGDNTKAQDAHVAFQIRKIRNVTIGANGQLQQLSTPDAAKRDYEVQIFNAKKGKLLEEYKPLLLDRTGNAEAIANLENKLGNLHKEYSSVIDGDAYTNYKSLFMVEKASLLRIQSGKYTSDENLDTLANQAAFLKRQLTDLAEGNLNDLSISPEIRAAAEAKLADKTYMSIDLIARINTLRAMTGLNSSLGNTSAQWFRENGLNITDLEFAVAQEADVSLPPSEK
tara:strand:- start:4932 stop:6809 length:1878 start_codon:yes stop_codon:yes gene_type:complete